MKPEKLYAVVGLIFGLLLLTVTPPFQAPDEPSHFCRAYQVSRGGGRPLKNPATGEAGGYLPVSCYQVWTCFADIPFNTDAKALRWRFEMAAPLALNPQAEQFLDFSSAAIYSPIPYLPAATGMALARWLDLPALGLLYLARLCNLLASILLIYIAIRLTPVLKWCFVIVALLPMFVFQAASLSADSLTLSLTLLFTAGLFAALFGEDASRNWRAVILLTVIGAMLALSKPFYLPLILLVWLIRPGAGESRRQWIWKPVLVCGATCAVLVLWSALIAPYYHPGRSDVPIAPGAQAWYVLTHPVQFIITLGVTFRQDLPVIMLSLVGWLGWMDTPLPAVVHILAWIFLAGVWLNDPWDQHGFTAARRMIVAAGVVACLIAIGYLLYLSFNAVGAPRIEGLQGRYFIPLLPVLLLVIKPRNLIVRIAPTRLALLAGIWAVLVMGLTLYALINRYYLPT